MSRFKKKSINSRYISINIKFYRRNGKLASITEKRLSLHKRVEAQKHQNQALKSQLADLQHLANIGTVSHMIAHEMNNLLTPLKSYATFALENPGDRALTEKALQKVVKNCGRAAKIMESMLALVSGEKQEKQRAQLLDLIDEIFTCLCRDFVKDGITVEIQVPGDLTVYVIPVQIQQVLMNLILNARDAMLPRGGILTIRATETIDAVVIEVSDTGQGIDPAVLVNIFETFYTTKVDKDSPAEHSGAGIGLAFCKMIIDRHQGCISVESKPGQGSTFKIVLPKTTVG
jgi:signal transduction histidine kinase